MMSILKIFIGNFIKFDFLIFLLASFNFYIYLKTLKAEGDIAELLYPSGYLPGGWQSHENLTQNYKKLLDIKGEERIVKMRRRMNASYSIFENITSIFPLMGILGTVISLIPMVQNISTQQNIYFFKALTSTFWGIVFAIIFKAINGYIEGKLSECEKNVEIYIQRNTNKIRANRSWGRYEKEKFDN